MTKHVTHVFWIVLLCAAACGDDDGTTTDAGSSATDAGTSAIDAFVPPMDAGICDVGDPPAGVTDLTGGFVFAGGDGGMTPPVPMGGEPLGAWVFDSVTFYVPEERRSQLDAEASSIAGQAWAVMDETGFRLSFFFDVTLETYVAGTIRSPSDIRARGTYTIDGAMLLFDAECLSGTMGGGDRMLTIGFTESGGSGQLILMTSSAVIVLEGTRT